MATTATNKQPMLVDHVLHTVVSLQDALVSDINFTGANTAVPLVNAIGTDGCIIEDIYSLSTGTTALTINLYFSRSQDYLRPTEGIFIGQFQSGSAAGERSEFSWHAQDPGADAPHRHRGAVLCALHPQGNGALGGDSIGHRTHRCADHWRAGRLVLIHAPAGQKQL